MDRAVRVGVLGLRRGAALARLAQDAGMQLVAVCERDDRRREAVTALGAAAYRDVEPFLEHGMDAVILVNDFDQHAPVAIRALDGGLSVLSETAACRTVAEGVALVESAERSSGVYMLAENYPYMPFTREMRRRYAAGDIGEVRLRRSRVPGRARRPRLDNGAVFKSLHGFLEGSQQAWVRLHGDRGLMENHRQGDTRTLRVVWDVEDGEEWRRAEEVSLPWPPEFSTSVSSCRSPASRRCAPAWPAACLSRSLIYAAPTSAGPTRWTIPASTLQQDGGRWVSRWRPDLPPAPKRCARHRTRCPPDRRVRPSRCRQAGAGRPPSWRPAPAAGPPPGRGSVVPA
jgi:hypothetical protein